MIARSVIGNGNGNDVVTIVITEWKRIPGSVARVVFPELRVCWYRRREREVDRYRFRIGIIEPADGEAEETREST